MQKSNEICIAKVFYCSRVSTEGSQFPLTPPLENIKSGQENEKHSELYVETLHKKMPAS